MTTARSLGTTHRPTRWVAALAATGAIAATSLAIGARPVTAAFSGLTQFEIDGDTAVDGGQDWASDPTVATNLNDAPFATDDGCRVSADPPADDDRIVQGSKIDDIAIDAPPLNAGNVPGKTDLCLTYRTWELVFVPTADPADDPAAGHHRGRQPDPRRPGHHRAHHGRRVARRVVAGGGFLRR